MMIQIIAAVIATVGFSVLFGVPSKYYPYCGVIGGAGWLVYLLTLEHFSTAGASWRPLWWSFSYPDWQQCGRSARLPFS